VTKEEWTRNLILRLASGHLNWIMVQEARDWLADKKPPERQQSGAKPK